MVTETTTEYEVKTHEYAVEKTYCDKCGTEIEGQSSQLVLNPEMEVTGDLKDSLHHMEDMYASMNQGLRKSLTMNEARENIREWKELYTYSIRSLEDLDGHDGVELNGITVYGDLCNGCSESMVGERVSPPGEDFQFAPKETTVIEKKFEIGFDSVLCFIMGFALMIGIVTGTAGGEGGIVLPGIVVMILWVLSIATIIYQ